MLKRKSLANRVIFFLLSVAMSVSFVGCGNQTEESKGDVVTFTDALDREIVVERNPKRVAALIGSFADVWQLSGGNLCASADDAWDDFGLDMGDAVKLGTVKKPNAEILLAVRPDFVLASAATAGHLEIKDILESAGITVAYFDVSSFEDYIEMLDVCTDITGRKDLFEKNGIVVQNRIDEIKKEFADENIPPEKKRVLFLRVSAGSIRAKSSKDSFFGEMLKEMGCLNIADNDKNLLDKLSIESIVKAEPYHIFAVQMGDDTEAVKKNLTSMIEENPALRELSAVREKRLHFMDKRLFNMKPNARWDEAYEILCEKLRK